MLWLSGRCHSASEYVFSLARGTELYIEAERFDLEPGARKGLHVRLDPERGPLLFQKTS